MLLEQALTQMPTSGDLKSGESISYSTPLPECQQTPTSQPTNPKINPSP